MDAHSCFCQPRTSCTGWERQRWQQAKLGPAPVDLKGYPTLSKQPGTSVELLVIYMLFRNSHQGLWARIWQIHIIATVYISNRPHDCTERHKRLGTCRCVKHYNHKNKYGIHFHGWDGLDLKGWRHEWHRMTLDHFSHDCHMSCVYSRIDQGLLWRQINGTNGTARMKNGSVNKRWTYPSTFTPYSAPLSDPHER